MENLDIAEDLSDGAKIGLFGLGGVVSGIVAWDLLADETISNAVRRQHEKYPVLGRAVTLGVLGGTALHLCLTEENDPFQKTFNKVMEKIR